MLVSSMDLSSTRGWVSRGTVCKTPFLVHTVIIMTMSKINNSFDKSISTVNFQLVLKFVYGL